MGKVYVRDSPGMGRGVFAIHAIEAGAVITTDPAVVVPAVELPTLRLTVLADYWWDWGADAAVVFGLSSMANHSPAPNARNRPIKRRSLMQLVALRRIERGEEITLDYGDLES